MDAFFGNLQLLTRVQMVDLCAKLYDLHWDDYWDHLFPVDGSYCAVKQIAGVAYVIWRGSTTAFDWTEDFTFNMVHDDLLGCRVHAGFRDGVAKVEDAVFKSIPLGIPVVVLGHSLGAAHALMHAARLLKRGHKVRIVQAYAPPRVGDAAFVALFVGLVCDGYINQDNDGHDLIPDVPFSIPVVEPFEQLPLKVVSASPLKDDVWGPFRYHHIFLYQSGIRALAWNNP